MAKPAVLISIKTMVETEDKAFGRIFMQHLLDEDRRLVPELVSSSERFKDPFIDIDHFVEKWWAMPVKSNVDDRYVSESFWGPLWKRKSTLASRGMVNHGLINAKNERVSSNLWFECRWHKDVDFAHLFQRWVELARPEIGMLHLFTSAELEILQTEAGSSFAVGSFGGRAKPGIPNIGWAMAYGESYASEIDVDRIKDAGFLVDVIDRVIVVRVTESLSDVVNDFAYFSSRRASLKNLFRGGLFWIEDEPDLM